MHESNNWSSNFFLDLGEVGAVGSGHFKLPRPRLRWCVKYVCTSAGSARLKAQKNPKALYVHCNFHVLNLVIVKACSLPSVCNMAGTITEISQFFNYFPKRQRCLENVISVDQPDSQRTKSRDLCRTCWVERHKAYKMFALLQYFRRLLKPLRSFWTNSSTNNAVQKPLGTGTERLSRRQMASTTHVVLSSFSSRS